MDYSRPELADRLAAAYVAGTLRGAARRRFVALTRVHPGLRQAVRDWEARLMPLTAAVEPVTPPPQVWQAIQRRIAPVVASGPAAAQPGWWGRLAVWRALTGIATTAAVTLAVLLVQPPPAQPPIVVVLSAAGAQAGADGVVPASFVASISGDGRALVTRPIQQVSLQADKALELWAVPPQGAPRSLGLISAQGATVVQRGRVLDNTAALAVSLEPPGGSPTGAPTGPILYIGKLTS
ncbi:anti-sigma factor domain-containing protein [Piscinibacter sp. HJYY11]|uniref:anti-sigma factor n=1 Tax=Piscinibacter sp. HJYY11 TaxID=2801333 RepID=UPI00191E18DC|nr:anti-sigma factor [Piscinibacter sp. HJYY11]MBL0729267.1 anti-sigma factor [Piscinibacter sp. HJYY11]